MKEIDVIKTKVLNLEKYHSHASDLINISKRKMKEIIKIKRN
jgi:hypothetical protein